MKTVKGVVFVLFAILLTTSLGMAAGAGHFKAKLSGSEETPAVMTKTTGEAIFKLSKNGKELTYELKVKEGENVTAAHIHAGKKGEEGPPVVPLFGGKKKEGMFSGVLAKGTITDKNLVGPLAGKTIEDLVKMIKEGGAYVNVHTPAHPGGEIRGQIE
ncbi:MAG TPA: CHRD domain-containing protein [Nitrospirota bacterium]|nr:CHRD domain-containing protein [Nitrospirota bacterium]